MHVNVLHYYITLHHPVRFNLVPFFPAGLILMVCGSGVGVRLKVGGKYWKDWRGGVWWGAVPSPVGGLWACPPEKKNQFCAKNYAILGKFWYFFPTLQQKVGFIPQSWKWGTYPPVPLLRRLWCVVFLAVSAPASHTDFLHCVCTSACSFHAFGQYIVFLAV